MKRYRIAIYIRLSMEDLDLNNSPAKEESCSISSQRRLIRTFLEQQEEFRDADIEEFTDDGYSGTNFDRPAVQRLLRLCRQGEIDCIVVKDLSRFGRNYVQVGDYLEQVFPFLGIRFIGINDGFDTKGGCGRIGGTEAAFKNFIYEMYSRDLSEKIKSGVLTSMKKGDYHSGCIVYGYQKAKDKKGIVIDEGAAVTIRRIFQDMADGKDAGTVARELNAEGTPTRLAYKQAKGEQVNRSYEADVWSRNKIHSIVHNPVYAGDMVYRKSARTKVGSRQKVKQPEKDWIVIRDHHEAIVSRELYQKANDSIRKMKAAQYDRSGVRRGIVFCGYCGSRLELHRTKTPYYLCRRRDFLDGTPCSELRINKETIEQTAMEIWREHCRLFRMKPMTELMRSEGQKLKKQENAVRQRVERCSVEKINLYQDFRSGNMTQELFLKKKEAITRRMAVLSEEAENISRKLDSLEEKQQKYQAASKGMMVSDRAERVPEKFMKSMAEKIIVYGDKRLEIVWRYEDEFERKDDLNQKS